LFGASFLVDPSF
jgi:hypothetical protein